MPFPFLIAGLVAAAGAAIYKACSSDDDSGYSSNESEVRRKAEQERQEAENSRRQKVLSDAVNNLNKKWNSHINADEVITKIRPIYGNFSGLFDGLYKTGLLNIIPNKLKVAENGVQKIDNDISLLDDEIKHLKSNALGNAERLGGHFGVGDVLKRCVDEISKE